MTVIDVTLGDTTVDVSISEAGDVLVDVPEVSVAVEVSDTAVEVAVPADVVVDVDAPAVMFAVDVPNLIPGAKGDTGEQGPPGLSGGSYVHQQMTPSATWTISHGLGYQPNVVVIDSAGTNVLATPQYPNPDTVVLPFSAAFGGTAYLS